MKYQPKIVKVRRPCQVTQLTFGNLIVYEEKEKDFPHTDVKTQNESYTVFRNGLNHYVFPTDAVKAPYDEICGLIEIEFYASKELATWQTRLEKLLEYNGWTYDELQDEAIKRMDATCKPSTTAPPM